MNNPETPMPEPAVHTFTLPLANRRIITISAPLDLTAKEVGRIQEWVNIALFIPPPAAEN